MMNALDLMILGVLAVWLAVAATVMVRNKKKGKCCGNCDACRKISCQHK